MLHILDYIFVDVAAQKVRSDPLGGSFYASPRIPRATPS